MAKPDRVDAAVLRVADAVGELMESWGFRRNMGRLWTVLYLEDHPLSQAELCDRLALSVGAISMLLAEATQWGIIKKTWLLGERREYYAAETSIWKMVSRVFRDRELRWIRTALDEFETASNDLRGSGARKDLIAARITGLTELARVGAHLLESVLAGESIDNLPIKQVGELAKIASSARRDDDD